MREEYEAACQKERVSGARRAPELMPWKRDRLEAMVSGSYCPAMQFLDLDRVRHAKLETDPFQYFVVPGFIPAAARPTLSRKIFWRA